MTQRRSPETPDAYLIAVQGDLTSWTGRLGELEMQIKQDPRYGQVTTLTGPVRDQAELFGILNTIYELHLPLLRLKTLKAPKQAEDAA